MLETMVNIEKCVKENFSTSVYVEMVIAGNNFIAKIGDGDKIIHIDNHFDKLSPMAAYYKQKMLVQNGGREFKFSYKPL